MLYLVAAIIGAVVPGPSDPDSGAGTREVLLVSGPIHYDLLLPLDTLSAARFAPLIPKGINLAHPEAEWLVIGWGAQDFYAQTPTYRDLSLSTLWRGIIGDNSVLRVDIIGAIRDDLPLRRLKLTESNYARLLGNIMGTLQVGPDGLPVRLDGAGFTPTDGFFMAKGRFNILRTCNVWIGEQLRAAGLRFGLWTPMPLSVSLSFDLYQGD